MVSNFRMKAIMRIVFTVNKLGARRNKTLKKTKSKFVKTIHTLMRKKLLQFVKKTIHTFPHDAVL